ncbi:MAG: heavy metal translocating P-type ATPase [Cellulosilyticaceae bacterium]
MRYRFRIEGIDCGHCATKIEELLKKEAQVKEASVQFVLKKVEIITYEDMNQKEVTEIVQKAADKVEDGISVRPILAVKKGSAISVKKDSPKSTTSCGESCGCGGHDESKHNKDTEKNITSCNESCGCGGHDESKHNKDTEKNITSCNESCGCSGHDETKHNEDSDKSVNGCGCGCTEAREDYNDKRKVMILWSRLAVSGILLGLGSVLDIDLLIVIAYFISAYDVLWRAMRNIRKGKWFDEHFLMSIATIAAFCIGDFAEAVAVILFYQVGEYFQSKAVAKSRKAITSLMSIKPERARVYRKGEWVVVTPEEVMVGERILVRPGEKIPLDSKILKGTSMLDTSMLTGESLPLVVTEGENVLSATINLETMLELEVTHGAEESTVAKVLEMIEHASSRKTTAEQFITRFAAWYTPTVVIGAMLLAIIPPLFTGDWHHWIYVSIVFLVISCPCALVVSVPLSFFGGIGAASKQGILVKGSNFLESLSTIDTVVLDKTGTITKGTFEVVNIVLENGITKEYLLDIAKCVEVHSNHPIAKAIVTYEGEYSANQIDMFSEKAGYGIEAKHSGKCILAGNKKLMEQHNVKFTERNELATWVYVAVDGQYIGAIGVADTIKTDTKEAIKTLKTRGIKKIIMLTGDKKEIAESIGTEVGVDEVWSELLPQHKVEKVEKLIDDGKKVAFVGDGINDAPALTLAHVGIAMGGIGADAAVEASDVVIMTDSLMKVASGIDIAKKTKRIVLQNVVLAIGVKLIVMLLGIFGFANMWLAIFSDVGVSVIAILNAIRLLRIKE